MFFVFIVDLCKAAVVVAVAETVVLGGIAIDEGSKTLDVGGKIGGDTNKVGAGIGGKADGPLSKRASGTLEAAKTMDELE